MGTLKSALFVMTPGFTPSQDGLAGKFAVVDPVEYYGSRFLVGLLVAGLLLAVYSLLRYRGRIAGPVSWGVLASAVLLLPAVSVAFGMVLVFQRAEQVEFCASCHLAMQRYADDMYNHASNSLAAVHYKNRYIPRNQCYNCHTSFGLFGTVQAKVAGVIDVHKYYAKTFKHPLNMREPYSNTECLKCHAEAVRWSKNHAGSRADIFAGKAKCMGCHGTEYPAHNLLEETP